MPSAILEHEIEEQPLTMLESIKRLTSDIKKASKTLGHHEARFLVDSYYALQDFRINSSNQVRQLSTKEEGVEPEPHETLVFFRDQFEMLENQIKNALDAYSIGQEPGRWLRSVRGIGPVIAAGLLAHIPLEKTPCISSLWRFAGLDPTSIWKKGEKRPWNASLRVISWKSGESFVKVCNHPEAVYGHIYAERKAVEIVKNDRKEFAEQAARILTEKKIGKDTDAYAAYIQGMLPPAHIHARAKRYAVKIFLSHYWKVLYESTHKKPAPRAYVFEHLGHVHEIPPPGWKSPV